MNLYFRKKLLGSITDLEADQPGLLGSFHRLPAANEFAELFAWIVDEDISLKEEPPFPQDWLTNENWFVEEYGKMRGMDVPAIHGDELI